MDLYIFARFQVRPGEENAAEAALLEVLSPSRNEDGCLSLHVFRSIRDPQLFYIHSHWTSEAAFDLHARLPHTVRFAERMEAIMDHGFDATRTEMIA